VTRWPTLFPRLQQIYISSGVRASAFLDGRGIQHPAFRSMVLLTSLYHSRIEINLLLDGEKITAYGFITLLDQNMDGWWAYMWSTLLNNALLPAICNSPLVIALIISAVGDGRTALTWIIFGTVFFQISRSTGIDGPAFLQSKRTHRGGYLKGPK
jgi:hypothetical protein